MQWRERAGTAFCALVLSALNALLLAVTLFAVGPWIPADDASARSALHDLALAVLAGSAVVAGLTWVFVKAEWVRRWWYVLPGLCAVTALVRLAS